MLRKTIQIGLCLLLLILLGGCETALGGGTVATTPTIVPLAGVAAASDTPTAAPTATDLPAPSPTPAAATATVTTGSASASPTPLPATETSVAAVSVSTPAGETTLSGSWDFSFGTMALAQQDSRVEGTYQWYGGLDTGRIEGLVVDELGQFRGVWISDRSPNSQQLLRWEVAADYNGFSGTAVSRATGQQWCGVRSGQPLPAGCGFSGDWQLRFGSPAGVTGQANLVQSGQTVQGTFVTSEGDSGEVEGVVTVESTTEMKLSGTWRSAPTQPQSFEWRLDLTTGQTFQGRREPGNSEWCGWREGRNPPEPCGW